MSVPISFIFFLIEDHTGNDRRTASEKKNKGEKIRKMHNRNLLIGMYLSN